MKNRAAMRRKSRAAEAKKAAEAREKAAPEAPAPRGFPPNRPPVAIAFPARTNPDGSPTGIAQDVTIAGYKHAIEVPEGGYTTMKRLRTDGSVENRGKYDDEDSEYR
jgi:hypothetical protein